MKKAIKKSVSLLLAAVTILSILTAVPFTISAATYGDFEYEILDNGTIKIVKYKGYSEIVEIPSTIENRKVTVIGEDSFLSWFGEHEEIIEVTIPSGVTHIGEYAFVGCANLKKVKLPDSLISISSNAFKWCYELSDINLPDGLTDIGYTAFEGSSLRNLDIPNSVSSIGDSAFSNCTSLKSVVLSNKLKKIAKGIFRGCSSLSSVTIPNSVNSIEECAFADCPKLISLTIPSSVTMIDDFAFDSYDMVITCTYGSCAHKYAEINNLECKFIPTYPENITSVNFTSTSTEIKMTWSKVVGAYGYYVYQKAGNKWIKKGTTTKNCYIYKELKPGTTYNFTIRGYYKTNNKTYMSPKYTTFTSSTAPEKMDFNLYPQSEKVTITWKKATGATGYKIYYKINKNDKWIILKDTKATTFTKANLKNGKTYYFTVKAYRIVNGKTYNGTYKLKSTVPNKPTISNTSVTTYRGGTKQIKILNILPSEKVTWKSNNTKIVTITSNGKITGKSLGNATVSAVYKGKTYKCSVSVKYLRPDTAAILRSYNTRNNYFEVTIFNNSAKNITIQKGTTTVQDCDYKSFDRKIKLSKSYVIKPGKTQTLKFYVIGDITWNEVSDFTLFYYFSIEDKKYYARSNVSLEGSKYKVGNTWKNTYIDFWDMYVLIESWY